MIIKQLDKLVYEDKYSKSGYEAEKQMAFYLKHKFSNSNNIFVFNNVRFSWLGDYTQIDHLIIHEYGMVIIESKSVTSKIKFNEQGEWTRLWNRHWEGMKNPIKQAERQGNSLRNILNNNREDLLKKIFGKTLRSFDKMPIDVVVAISDKCSEIKRPRRNNCKNVVKADLVTDYIEDLINKYKKEDVSFSFSIPWAISSESMARIKEFVLSIHEPIFSNESEEETHKVPPQSSLIETKSPLASNTSHEKEDRDKIYTLTKCPECNGVVCIMWGARYKNYYWHCNECGKNISINHKCPECKQKLKVRKQKNEYFIYCEPCELEVLYHSVEVNE